MKNKLLWNTFLLALGLAIFAGVTWLLENMHWAPGGQEAALGLFILVCIAALVIAVYLLPTISAWYHRHPHLEAIAILNLLLGWTLLGWVAALVWSFVPVRARD